MIVIQVTLSEAQKDLLSIGTCLEGRYYYLPFWFEKVDDTTFLIHTFEKLPTELINLIQKHRGDGNNNSG